MSHAIDNLVWQLNPYAVLEHERGDPTSWGGSVQHELLEFGLRCSVTQPRAAGTPYPDACVVMMVKDEADIIGENLRWLHYIGIRKFVMLDNNSSDETPAIIRDFRQSHHDVELLTIHDPVVRHIQAEKTTGAFRLAMSIWHGLRWVFPIDADEFLIPQHGLAALDQIAPQTSALTIPKVIHFRHRQHGLGADSVLGAMPYRSPLFCVPPKVAARCDLGLTITQGNHQVVRLDGRPACYEGGFTHGFYYREFPNRSFEHLARKIRNGGPAILAAERYFGREGAVGGQHWLQYHQVLVTGGDAELRRLYEEEWVRGDSPDFVLDPFIAGSGPQPRSTTRTRMLHRSNSRIAPAMQACQVVDPAASGADPAGVA